MDPLSGLQAQLQQFDQSLHQLNQRLNGWIPEHRQRTIIPTRLAIWLEVLLLALRALLLVLEALLLALLRELLKLRVALGPPVLIHKLPTELMIEILLSALEGTGRSPRDLQRLASVCKYWRNIILNNSRFWLVIDSGYSGHSYSLVLKRNQFGPLDVSIRGREGRRNSTEIISHLIRLITPESRRIRSLNIVVKPNAPYFRPFFETTSLPSLTHLTVSVIPRTAFPAPIHIKDGVSLRHLCLDNVVIPWDTTWLHGLETLDLSNLHQDSPTIAQLHYILSSTPFLRELSLFNWNPQLMPGYWTTQEISPVTLPLLTHVEVQGLPEDIHPRLLFMLDLPLLRDINWIATECRTVQSGLALLCLSAQCIKSSPELVISVNRWSPTLAITSKKWTSTPARQEGVERCKSVDLSINTNTFRLMRQVATLVSDRNSILLETDSKNSAKRARKFFLRSGAFFAFNITRSSPIRY